MPKNLPPLRLIETGSDTDGAGCIEETREGLGDHRPSAFYFRRALRSTSNPAELREIALCIVRELESVKQWAAEQTGASPPKTYVLKCEAVEKGLLVSA